MSDITYTIDEHDQIRAISTSWRPFAENNGGPDPSQVLGRPLWDFIDGQGTSRLYRVLMGEVRRGRTLSFPLRCDSPTVHRLLAVRIAPTRKGDVEFRTRVCRIRRASRGPVDGGVRTMRATVTLCAQCLRVRMDRAWVPADVAVERQYLFSRLTDPSIVEITCPDCHAATTDPSPAS